MGSCESRCDSGFISVDGGPLVMRRYRQGIRREDNFGCSPLSTWYRAIDIETGQEVALKVYKDTDGYSDGSTPRGASQRRFRQQVAALQELQRPFEPPLDAALWSEDLAWSNPSELFPRLLNYSKDVYDNPGVDSDDGGLYVVTEYPRMSLKDHLQVERARNVSGTLPTATFLHMSHAMLTASAGLHAKNLVHFCLGPESFAIFGDTIKLFDVDGCVRAGTSLSMEESSAARPPPTRCSPELSRFFLEEGECPEQRLIDASPSLDVWSAGISLCELAGLSTDVEERYESCSGSIDFLEWLGDLQDAPITAMNAPDGLADFVDFARERLLVCDRARRGTLAQCLSNPVFKPRGDAPSSSDPEDSEEREKEPSFSPTRGSSAVGGA